MLLLTNVYDLNSNSTQYLFSNQDTLTCKPHILDGFSLSWPKLCHFSLLLPVRARSDLALVQPLQLTKNDTFLQSRTSRV